jgi:ketosteroid isomerase-like protein
MTTESLTGLATRFLSNMREPDASMVAEDFQWWMSFRPDTMNLDEFREHVRHIALPPIDMEIIGLGEAPDRVTVEVQGRCLLPDGRRYDNNYCFIVIFRGRKIREVREYCDTKLAADLFGGLGVPATGGA